MLFMLIAVFMLGMAAYDVPPMIRSAQWRELRAYGILWVFALALGILQATGIELPNPTTFIVATMTALVKAVAALFGL